MPNFGSAQLRAFVARIEKLEEEKATIMADIREVYAEARAMGFDTKALRSIIRMRKMDPHEREELAAVVSLYMHHIGMTPLEALAAGLPVQEEDEQAEHVPA